MRNVTYVKIIFAVIFFILLVIGGMVALSGISLFNLRENDIPEKSTTFNRYRQYLVDPSTRTSHVLHVELPRELNGEYEYYVDGQDRYNLISELGTESKTYYCTGSCHCSNNDEEFRRTTSILTRPLFYLLMAASTTVAYERAKTYFNGECATLMSSEDSSCSSSTSSTVEECDTVPEQKENEEKDDYEFYCNGNCLPADLPPEVGAVDHPYDLPLDCGQKVLNEKIKIKISKSLDNETPFIHPIIRATEVFAEEHLDPFCLKYTQFTFGEISNPDIAGKTMQMCVGIPDGASCYRTF